MHPPPPAHPTPLNFFLNKILIFFFQSAIDFFFRAEVESGHFKALFLLTSLVSMKN
jgi:hypothetical protein